MTLLSKSHGIENYIFNTISVSGDKITPGINPKRDLMHLPCPDNSKKK